MEVVFGPPPLGHPSDCRVFIPGMVPQFDFSDLIRFSAHPPIQVADIRSIYPDDASEHEAKIHRHLRQKLTLLEFDPKRDYIALAGDLLIIACLFGVLGTLVDKVCILRYDGAARHYWPFALNLGKHKGIPTHGSQTEDLPR